ncbi:MAG TPA: aldo/keto reductase [Polyangiales bacterium]|nr:aldo/keto reductase [Polyangiales bacterium]
MTKTKTFGASGVQVSTLGQGTWQMENDNARAAVEALRAGIDLGMTHIDTAELYGSGRVEQDIVSQVIRGQRERVYLVSKVMPSHANKKGTLSACEQSLKRLGTDYLDCYLLHWPGRHPLEETIAAFEKLRADGKIRAWGVSNFDVPDLERALAIAGPGKIACNQVLYHLKQRDIENAVGQFCTQNNIAIVGYTPFGRAGFPPAGAGGKALAQIALRYGATPRQVALAFLMREPNFFAIPKASDVAHTGENAGALQLTLDASDLEAIEAAFPRPTSQTSLPMF